MEPLVAQAMERQGGRMTSNSTDQPTAEQLAAEIDRLHQRIDRLQFWLNNLYRQTGKLAELIAEQETK